MRDHVWYTHSPSPTAFGIALRKGWVHEELAAAGVEVRALGASSDPDVQRFRRERTSPRAFRQGGNVAPLVARSRGNDVRLIGLSRVRCEYPLLTLPDSPLRSAQDLVGKRIAIPRRPNTSVDVWRATAQRTAANLLATAGLTLNEVELVDVNIKGDYFESPAGRTADLEQRLRSSVTAQVSGAQAAEALALARGEVDAIASEGATASVLQATLGLVPVRPGPVEPAAANNRSLLAVTVSGGLLDREPDLVTRVLIQILAAAEWSIDEEPEARRLIALDSGVHEDLLDSAFGSRISRQLSVDLRPDKLEALRSQHDFLVDRGFLSEEIDFDAFVEPGPLQTALAQRGVLI